MRHILAEHQIPADKHKPADLFGHARAGDVYKITVGRDDLKITEMGASINARMGLNTWAAFVGSNDNAAIAIYHTINGRRTEKKRASVKVASNKWHTLRVEFAANHFVVSFNGQKPLEWDDDTFKDAGKVGVWTKADSVTEFDDFTYGAKYPPLHARHDISLVIHRVRWHRVRLSRCRPRRAQYDDLRLRNRPFSELVLQAYQQRSAVRVTALYDSEETKSTGLANRMLEEKYRPQAECTGLANRCGRSC